MWTGTEIGIDMGTENTRVVVSGKGLVLEEPSLAALHARTGQLLAVGEQALELSEKEPYSCKLVKPVFRGMISRYGAAVMLLREMIGRVTGMRTLVRPRVALAIAARSNDVERRLWHQAAADAGARGTVLIESPMAAAIGAGIDVFDIHGSMVVDIGAGVTDVGVVSMGGLVMSDRLSVGGDSFDDAVRLHVRKVHGLTIGRGGAQKARIDPGQVRGRDLATGLPRSITLSDEEVASSILPKVDDVAESVRRVLAGTPPEIAVDIAQLGMLFTGGASRTRGLAAMISEKAGVVVRIAPNAETCVVKGLGRFLEGMDPRVTSGVKSVL